MEAIIRFDLPPVGQYYTLPVFESYPKKIPGLCWEWWLREKYNVEKQYILIFKESNVSGIFNQMNEWEHVQNPELTEDQIYKINKLYFYMLDHPELKEASIDL